MNDAKNMSYKLINDKKWPENGVNAAFATKNRYFWLIYVV
jgi:hypothetical protein